MSVNYYTAEGLKKLNDELVQLKKVERPSVSKQIAEAREKGDLSENAEYDAAKEAQGLLEMKISKLETVLSNARLIDDTNLDASKALILSKVKVKNLTNSACFEYILVSEKEANIKENKISINSPIGKGLLGKELGDIVEIQIPSGIIKFEVIELSR